MVIWDEKPQGTLLGNDRRRAAKRNFDQAAKRIAEREQRLRDLSKPVDEMEEECTRA